MQTEDPILTKLKKRIDSNKDERERYQKMYKDLEDRVREVSEAKQVLRMSFWCDACDADVDTKGTKIVRMHSGKLPIAWWVGFCPSRHKLIRRITDKVNDPYYNKSVVVKKMRSKYRDDLLTPDDDRFWLLYGHLHGAEHYKTLDLNDRPAHTY